MIISPPNPNTSAAYTVEAQADMASLYTTDEQLLCQLAEGDASALETLYDRYVQQCFGLAHRMLGDSDLAERAVQEVFTNLWVRPDSYPASYSLQKGQFPRWILNSTHNRCLVDLRSLRLKNPERALVATEAIETVDDPVTGNLLDIIVDTDFSAADPVLLSEQRRELQQVLRRLAPERLLVIELAYFGGLSQAEIAASLRQPLSKIKSHTTMALQELQALIS